MMLPFNTTGSKCWGPKNSSQKSLLVQKAVGYFHCQSGFAHPSHTGDSYQTYPGRAKAMLFSQEQGFEPLKLARTRLKEWITRKWDIALRAFSAYRICQCMLRFADFPS